MKAYIIHIDYTFRGDSGHDVLDCAFTDNGNARDKFNSIVREERDNTWLSDVLDEDCKPYNKEELHQYIYDEEYFDVEDYANEARTEIWIQELNLE